MDGKSEKKEEVTSCQKKCYKKNLKGEKKVVDMTRHWSVFTLKSKFTQHNFHYTCNLALHTAPWRTPSSFLFFLNGGKKPLHYDRDTDHLFVVLHFAEPPQFLNTVNWGNLSFHHKRQCTESVALRQVLAPP